jgi:putative membrane protein
MSEWRADLEENRVENQNGLHPTGTDAESSSIDQTANGRQCEKDFPDADEERAAPQAPPCSEERSMAGEKFRCHPSIIVENSARTFFSIVILLIFLGAWIDSTAVRGILALSPIALLLFYSRQWKRTTIQFNETDVVVERDTLFQMKKTLPYTKMASVNVNRDIANRVFGTSKVLININSGASATTPEAVLTFRQDVAERLRSEMSQRLYDHAISPDEEETIESLATFTPLDVIIHGLFSVSTYQTILGSMFLAYSVFELYLSMVTEVELGAGAMVSLVMFVTVQIMPSVSLMFRYYNYKVYRRGDTIYLQHGLIRTYRTSFSVSRINAVRVKSTLAARILGRSCIEAEVVGLASESDDSSRPVLCLLKDDATQQRVFRELVPEFVYERDPERQPEGAKSVLQIRAVVASLVLAAVMCIPSLYVSPEAAALSGITGIPGVVVQCMLPLGTALAVLATLYAAHVSFRVTEFDAGENLFTFVNGAVDRETAVMNYDKVQMIWIAKGPIARVFGVSRGSVYMLSSTGSSSITSGYFPEGHLNRLNEIVMDRIASGRYDYRLNSV